ncbi:uncharacterized protein [Clytia hemisphaerica]|uniref:Uncharacterized protein n=1 Tax=Clytia hemisphaerica TaxID=252671 RepID=A0A7M5UFT3_9CNID
MESQMKTQLIQNAIFFLLVISGVLIIAKIQQQDWMTEEINSDYRHFRSTFEKVANKSNYSALLFTSIYRIPDDAIIRAQLLFGVRTTCQRFTLHNLKSKYLEFVIPKIEWCVDNDLFTNPENYEVPEMDLSFAAYKNEAKALNQAFICMVMAMVLVCIAFIMQILKNFKWKMKLNIAIIISTLIACSFIIAALSIVHTKFNFKRDFEKNRQIIKHHHQQLNSIDNDDGSGYGMEPMEDNDFGYSQHYTKNTSNDQTKGSSNHYNKDASNSKTDNSQGYSGHYNEDSGTATTDKPKGYSGHYVHNTTSQEPAGETENDQPSGYTGHYPTNHSIFINHDPFNYTTTTFENYASSLERGFYDTILLLLVLNADYHEYIGTPLTLGKINIALLLLVILLSLLDIRCIKKTAHGGDVGVKYRRASLTEDDV